MTQVAMNQFKFNDESTGDIASVYVTTSDGKYSIHSPISSDTSNKNVTYTFTTPMSNVQLDGIYRMCPITHTGVGASCPSSKIETIGLLDNYAASKIILQWRAKRTDNWSDVDTIYVDSSWLTRQIVVGGQVNWMYDSNGNTKSSLSHSAAGYYRLYITVIGSRWNTQGSCNATQFGYTFNTYIDATLLENHTVHYYVNGEERLTATKFYGEPYEISGFTPSVSGYTFTGWSTSAGATIPEYTEGDLYYDEQDLYLHAVLTQGLKIIYTDSGADSGRPPVDNNEYSKDGLFFTMGNSGGLQKRGYTLIGWSNTSTGSTYDLSAGPYVFSSTSNITLSPRWAKRYYRITYNGNEATSGTPPTDDSSYDVGSSFVVKTNTNLVKTGYSFSGWNTRANGTGTHYTQGVAYQYPIEDDLTLYAEWIQGSGAYTLTYSANGGSNPPTDNNRYNYNDRFTPPSGLGMTPPSGKPVFDGWWPNEQGLGMPQFWPLSPTRFTYNANKTFYAKWSSSGRTITYVSGGADSGTPPVDNTLYSASEQVSFVPAYNTGNLYRDGYVFGGWKSNIGLEFTPGVEEILRNNETTFTPIWNKRVILTYDGNGNTYGFAPPTQHGATGDTLQLYGNIGDLAKAGAAFNGWNTAPDGSGTHYVPGESTITLGNTDIVLYAEWTGTRYNVTVTDPEHGTITPTSGTYFYGDTIQYSVAADDGWQVAEWDVVGPSAFDTETQTLTVLGTTTVTCTMSYDPGDMLDVQIVTHGAVSVSQSSATIPYGTSLTISASYQSGCMYDTVDIISGTCIVASVSGDSFTITPSTNCVIRIRAKHQMPQPITTGSQVSKYSIVVYNRINLVILTRGIRKDESNNTLWISDISVSSKLDGVGSGSFALHTNSNNIESVVAIDSDMILLENGVPVYYGVITSVKKSENNFYGNHSFTGIHEYSISFSEATRTLNYKSSPDAGVITANPGCMVYSILGNDLTGDIDTSTSSTTFTVSPQNMLSLLDKLGDQVGWRYRCRPYILSFDNITSGSFPTSGNTGTIRNIYWRNVKVGDLIIVTDGTSTHVYVCNTESEVASSVSFSAAKHIGSSTLVSPTVCRVRRFVVDFKPSFYQTNSVLIQDSTIPSSVTNRKAWSTNYTAMNNNDANTESVKYGSVSVSSSQGNGEVYSSTIPLIRKHNTNYSYEFTTYISSSMDASVVDWSWDSANRKLSFTIPGGDDSLLYDLFDNGGLYLALNYYANNLRDTDRGLFKYLELSVDNPEIDQEHVGNIIAITSGYPTPNTWFQVLIAEGSTTQILLDTNTLKPNSISSTTYTVSNPGQLISSPSSTIDIQLGGESCRATVTQTGNKLVVTSRTYPTIHDSGIYYGIPQHRIGCIVMKGTIQSADSDSPYAKYPERTLCAEMQSGYPYIDVDYIASNYALFGSNFDSQGTCKVPLVKFTKVDNQKYNLKGLLNVGDHIAIYKSYSSGSDASKDYELLEYKVDLDKMMVDVKYGTKTIDLGSTLYNLRKNISTNITRF